jgi:hypothetical protein
MKIQKQKTKKAGGKFKMCEERSESAFVPSLSPRTSKAKRENVQEINKTKKNMYVLRYFHDFKDNELHMWPGSSFELRRIYQWKNVKYPAKNAYEKSYHRERHQIVET